MEYVIAIPSYKRSNILFTKTLATLARHFTANDNTAKIHKPPAIYIFVASDQEKQDYISASAQYTLNNHLITQLKYIIGVKGLKNQRNFICDFFPENQHIVQLDDDLDEILELVIDPNDPRNNRKYRVQPVTHFGEFIKSAFEKCAKQHAYIWGIYPVPNAYFMTPSVTTDLRFIVGPMFGIINRHDQRLHLTTDEKENVERTLQYFTLDGIVIRFNNITVDTTYFSTVGGMQASQNSKQRREAALKAAQYLHNLYPDITKIYTRKKSGWPELLLNKKAAPRQTTSTTIKTRLTKHNTKTLKH